jgi:hypothetical protein
MACPHVVGSIAMILSKSSLSPIEIKKLLIETSDPVDVLKNTSLSGGRINLLHAYSNE